MMSKQSGKNDVGIPGRVVGERIADHPVDALCGRGCLSGRANSVRIEVDAGQSHGNLAFCCPGIDAPQHIAITTPYIHNAQRFCWYRPGLYKLVEPGEGGPWGKGKTVRKSKICTGG